MAPLPWTYLAILLGNQKKEKGKRKGESLRVRKEKRERIED
jgi:hypothetical protein